MPETEKQIDTVQGVHLFLLYRILGDDVDGIKIAQQTEHSTSSTRDANSTATKDGNKRTLGAVEQEIELTTLLSNADDVDRLYEAHEQGKKVELWEVDGSNKTESLEYKMTYYQGYITDIKKEAPTDDGVEVSFTFAIESYGKRGQAALSEEQQAVVDYAFVKPYKGTTVEAVEGTGGEASASTGDSLPTV